MPLKLNIYSGTGMIELQDANNGILQFSFSGQVSISESSNTHTNVYGHLLEYGRKVNFEAEIFETSKEIIDNLVLRKDILQTIKITGLETVVTITDAIIVFDISRQYPNKTHKIILKSSTLKDNVNISVGINPLLIPDANTVTQYWFNSLNETPLEDLSGNGHTLTPSANFDWQDQFNNPAPQGGSALFFDGTDDYLSVDADDFIIGASQSVTFEVIFKTPLNDPPANNRIVSANADTGSVNRYAIDYQTVRSLHYYFNDVDILVQGYSGNSFSLNTWKYIALVFDRAAGISILYVNGVNENFEDISAMIEIIPNNLFVIGCQVESGTPDLFYNSDISEVVFSNIAKSEAEIQATWDRIKGYF